MRLVLTSTGGGSVALAPVRTTLWLATTASSSSSSSGRTFPPSESTRHEDQVALRRSYNYQQRRSLHHQGYRTGRIYRYFGLRPLRVPPPRTDWQNAREREFLKQRLHCPTKQPNGDIAYVRELTSDDLMQLRNSADNSSYNGIEKLLRLNCASGKELSKFRKKCLINKFAVSPFDTNSPAVRIATLTEKILNLRAHMIRCRRDSTSRRVMTTYLSRRMKVMKALYKADFLLYKYVCESLGLKLVRFAIPEYRDVSRRISPMAVDGDKAKWLIRQKLFRKRNHPRMFMDGTKRWTGRSPGTLVRFTHHPIEPVPEAFGRAKKSPQQLSPHFPYGVRKERVEGKGIVYNPTEPGVGYQTARLG